MAEQPAPAKKTGISGLVVVVFIIGGIALAGVCISVLVSRPSSGGTSTNVKMTYRVTYRVTGSAKTVDVTYNNAGGDTEQKADVKVPWQTSFTGRYGLLLYVSAQNQGKSGTVKCEIVLDGTVVKSSQSEGGYVIATCSGALR